MKEELMNAYQKIKHPDKIFSISHYGNTQNDDVDYSIILTFSPDILSDLKKHPINENKNFKYEMLEFGGIVFYNGEKYIRRIDANYNEELKKGSTNRGMGFTMNSKKSEFESTFENYYEGETIIEYFSLDDVREKLYEQLDNAFVDYKIDDEIYLKENYLIYKIWPHKGFRSL